MLAAAVALACLASAASAEIYRCAGPGGEVRFTSDASKCSQAQPIAPKEGRVLRVEKKEAPLVSARPGALATPQRAPAAASEPEAGAEALWRQKRTDAQQKLDAVKAKIDVMTRATHLCNRGNDLWTEDAKTGLRHEIDCKEVDVEKGKLAKQQRELEQYLAEGLAEECRQAGCLPGWLR